MWQWLMVLYINRANHAPGVKGHLWIKWEFSLIDKYVTFIDAKAWLFVVSVFWHILKVSDTIYVGFNIFMEFALLSNVQYT